MIVENPLTTLKEDTELRYVWLIGVAAVAYLVIIGWRFNGR